LSQVPAWPRVQSRSTFHPQGKLRENIRMNYRAFLLASRQFIPSQIIIASTKRPRRTHPGAPFLFCLVPPSAPHPPRQLPAPGTPEPTRCSCAAKPRQRVPDDVLRVAAAAGGAHRQPSPSGQRRTVRQGGNVWHRLGGTRRRRFRPVASGRRQSDAERGIGSDPTLNVEGRVGGNETLNVGRGVGRERRVINRRAEGWRSGLKGRTTSAK
jgi:hypothetical protein